MRGQQAPGFTLTTLDGKTVSSQDFPKHKATVLNFVAPNCGFCKKQVPTVEKVRADYEAKGVRFVNIAGNDEILVTALAPAGRTPDVSPAQIASLAPLPTDRSRVRLALRVPVRSLHDVLTRLVSGGITIEHLYDY